MRGKRAPKRDIQPDKIYNSVVVTKLINRVMLDGRKATAMKNVYAALQTLEEQTKEKAADALSKALDKARPRIEVRSRRVGGSNYQVPVPVIENRQYALALRWIVDAARSGRGNKSFSNSLARELVAAYNGEGNVIKKKEDIKKMAEANRAFAQFA